jgi:hypothetical protein
LAPAAGLPGLADLHDQLLGRDEHSVAQQLHHLCDRHLTIRLLRLAGRRAELCRRPSMLRNPLVFSLLHEGYVAAEALSIRKLLEAPAAKAAKQIYSLRRVVKEVEDLAPSLTRRAYVERDGVPYDGRADEQAWFAQLGAEASAAGGHVVRWGRPRDFGFADFETSERRHRQFDLLSGRSAAARSPDDLVNPGVFAVLWRHLEVPGRSRPPERDGPIAVLYRIANKRIAHAADPYSRSAEGQLPSSLSLRHVTAAHVALLGVAQFIAAWFFDASLGDPLPAHQYDILEFFEQAGCTPADLTRLALVPHALGNRYAARTRRRVEEIEAEIAWASNGMAHPCPAPRPAR